MPSHLAQVHRLAQRHLQQIVAAAVGAAWANLGHYDQTNVPTFMGQALPIVEGGQRQSAALVSGFMARTLKIAPFGLSPANISGAAVRNGTAPETVYMRSFIGMWQDLGQGKSWQEAVQAGQARVQSAASMDVSLAQRASFQDAQDTINSMSGDTYVYGYERVASGTACSFCEDVSGAFCKSGDAMPLHNNCSCSLEPLTSEPTNAKWLPSGDSTVDGAGIRDHGELGAVLTNPDDSFMTESEALANG